MMMSNDKKFLTECQQCLFLKLPLLCRFYFLVLLDHGFHCGTLNLLEDYW